MFSRFKAIRHHDLINHSREFAPNTLTRDVTHLKNVGHVHHPKNNSLLSLTSTSIGGWCIMYPKTHHLVRTHGYICCIKRNHNQKISVISSLQTIQLALFITKCIIPVSLIQIFDVTDRYSGIRQYIVHSSENTCRLQHLI